MLSIDNISCDIKETPILCDVSFQVLEGETLGIIGPNGSGKTTLFNCISGFQSVRAGTIRLNNCNIEDLPAFERARLGLGRVFQNFGVFSEMTLLDNMITALESRQSIWATFFPWSKTCLDNSVRARDYLNDINLAAKEHLKASSLSGGQKRLLEIVRTLAFGANVFLLDEPTAGVSPKMKDDIARMILKLRELKKTVLVIEHDIDFIQKFCDRILVLDQGRVVLEDTPVNVRSSPLLQEIYFGNNKGSSSGAS